MARFLSAAVLLTAVLAPAVNNAVALAQLTSGCTSSSFTTPSWLVRDFQSQTSGNLTVVDFHVLNRGTNVTTELRCSASSATTTSGWQPCSARNRTTSDQPFVAYFQVDNSTAWFLFNETWSCTTTACQSTKPLLVKAALSAPVKITPGYVSGPVGHDTKGCTAQSRTPAWEVVASQINLRNVSGNVQSGNAFVIIRNDHLGYTASCGGSFSDVSGHQPLSCQGQTAFRRPDKYQIGTNLQFDPKTFALGVNQTWFCDDLDPAQPIAITASGSTPPPLECTDFPESSHTFCTGGSNGTFAGNITSRALLQPYSLNDPLPTAESCTIASVLSPAWWFNNFETNTTRNGSETVTARFGMELQTGAQATGYVAEIVANGVRYAAPTNGTSAGELPWNKCVIESVGDPVLAPTGCEFRYEMASRFLGLRVQWQCADLDAKSP
ncbi:hypothetical protein NEMBOFW57_007821 [Staphylotrichum longicolle]|uniref:Uncharacterized protein n=1 Tax=Staphylotrichum longicolle TaxID=669026 RepID=A0AAD4EW56_9PEZI|nr:hypothetical protein NEMBOFW57_007821 [Staphylotrichum longicolle]